MHAPKRVARAWTRSRAFGFPRRRDAPGVGLYARRSGRSESRVECRRRERVARGSHGHLRRFGFGRSGHTPPAAGHTYPAGALKSAVSRRACRAVRSEASWPARTRGPAPKWARSARALRRARAGRQPGEPWPAARPSAAETSPVSAAACSSPSPSPACNCEPTPARPPASRSPPRGGSPSPGPRPRGRMQPTGRRWVGDFAFELVRRCWGRESPVPSRTIRFSTLAGCRFSRLAPR